MSTARIVVFNFLKHVHEIYKKKALMFAPENNPFSKGLAHQSLGTLLWPYSILL